MDLIYIEETYIEDQGVAIKVDGELDVDSIELLQEVCDRHLKNKLHVTLDLKGLLNISRSGRDFLATIQNKVIIINPPLFLDF
jgi:anti-anti-sigma regulatory factor